MIVHSERVSKGLGYCSETVQFEFSRGLGVITSVGDLQLPSSSFRNCDLAFLQWRPQCPFAVLAFPPSLSLRHLKNQYTPTHGYASRCAHQLAAPALQEAPAQHRRLQSHSTPPPSKKKNQKSSPGGRLFAPPRNPRNTESQWSTSTSALRRRRRPVLVALADCCLPLAPPNVTRAPIS